MRTLNLIPRGLTVAALLVGVSALSGCGSADVTRSALEGSLAPTFANLYAQQATILGHRGVTAGSIGATATCDKGGPKVADVGPGADWICMVTFADDTHTIQNGKFELQAKSNSCYTAAGPSKLIGLVTITDTHGKDVPNPVFEFDGCFAPGG